jgi:hypothetical protein
LERIGEAKGTEGTAGWSVKPLADIGREPEAAKAERSAETGDESKPGQIAGGRLRYRIVRLVRASLRLVSPPGKRPGGPGKRRYKVFRKAN